MRILHLERQGRMSGQTYRVLREAAGLRERGHGVALACRPESALAPLAAGQGVEVYPLAMRGLSFYASALRLRRIIGRGGFQIVHAHGGRDHVLGALALAGRRAPALVRTKHNQVRLHRGRASRFLYVGLTRRIIAVSAAVRDGLIADGVPAERIRVIRDGVDVRRFAPRGKDPRTLSELGLREEHVVIGAAGRLDSGSMDTPTLLRAFARLVPRYPQARLLLAGRAPDRAGALAEELDLSQRAVFTGFREDMPEILSVMDVFVQPNVKAALGTALIEAQAMGKPVVATRVGGHAEVVAEGGTGLLCPAESPEAMAAAIARLIEDSALRAAMGQAARERAVRLFAEERMLDGLEAFYAELLAGAP